MILKLVELFYLNRIDHIDPIFSLQLPEAFVGIISIVANRKVSAEHFDNSSDEDFR
jgi:hypothetical protein